MRNLFWFTMLLSSLMSWIIHFDALNFGQLSRMCQKWKIWWPMTELFDCFCCLCPVCWRVEGVVIHGSVVLFVDYAYSTTLTTLFQTNHSHPGKWEMLRLRFGLLSLGLIKTKKKGFIEQQYAQKQFLYNIHSLGQQCDTRMQRGTVRHYNVATV